MITNLMAKWIHALRSEKYEQGTGSLAKPGVNKPMAYCCLGVADKVCFNAEFFPSNDWDYQYEDDLGAGGTLPDTRKNTLNLHLPIKAGEIEAIEDHAIDAGMDVTITTDSDRESVLIDFNDNGATFYDIADLIEKMGWDQTEVAA